MQNDKIFQPNNPNVWYFAHPYTCKDSTGKYISGGEDANFQLCCIRSAKLIERGWIIYSPISHTHPIHKAWPPFVAGELHDFWYQFDNAVIDGTNFAGIILAPGWKTSTGCKNERQKFLDADKRVLLYDDIMNDRVE
jgi:hypothetical protein